jgi:hypothetical protein
MCAVRNPVGSRRHSDVARQGSQALRKEVDVMESLSAAVSSLSAGFSALLTAASYIEIDR